MVITVWTIECFALLKGTSKGNITNAIIMFTNKLVILLKIKCYITRKMSIHLPTHVALLSIILVIITLQLDFEEHLGNISITCQMSYMLFLT